LPEQRKCGFGATAILNYRPRINEISRQCASPFTSPTSHRIPGRYCAYAAAWESRRTSSSRRGFRPPTARFAAREWITWTDFEAWRGREACRVVLFTTQASKSYLDFSFAPDDVLLFGRESAGAPEAVHAAADARLLIPMRPGMRSLNVAMAAALAAGEALRQTGALI
jgi:hypothetical protein